MKERNFTRDNLIDVSNIREELRDFPSTLYSYLENKSDLEASYESSKANYEMVRSQVYIEVKSTTEKVTEAAAEARINTDPRVLSAQDRMFKLKRDFETLKNYTESLRAKKDMLVQISADLRKEQ